MTETFAQAQVAVLPTQHLWPFSEKFHSFKCYWRFKMFTVFIVCEIETTSNNGAYVDSQFLKFVDCSPNSTQVDKTFCSDLGRTHI